MVKLLLVMLLASCVCIELSQGVELDGCVVRKKCRFNEFVVFDLSLVKQLRPIFGYVLCCPKKIPDDFRRDAESRLKILNSIFTKKSS